MFLITDTVDYHRNGVLVVRLNWDDMIDGKTAAELLAEGSRAEKQTQRMRVTRPETTTIFNMIVKDYRPWKHEDWTFLVYGGRKVDEFNLLDALDKRWDKRLSGSERFLHGTLFFSVLQGT
jgi:hypothetical protein